MQNNFKNEAPLGQGQDKRLYEAQWAQQLAEKHSTAEIFKRWQAYYSTDRVYLSIGTKIVHWERIKGVPTVIDSLTLRRIAVTLEGIAYFFEESSGGFHVVTHVPRLLGKTKVFAWVPHFSEFRHTPHNWSEASVPGYVTSGLCVWQQSNPEKSQYNNHAFITTLKVFEREWSNTTTKG